MVAADCSKVLVGMALGMEQRMVLGKLVCTLADMALGMVLGKLVCTQALGTLQDNRPEELA